MRFLGAAAVRIGPCGQATARSKPKRSGSKDAQERNGVVTRPDHRIGIAATGSAFSGPPPARARHAATDTGGRFARR